MTNRKAKQHPTQSKTGQWKCRSLGNKLSLSTEVKAVSVERDKETLLDFFLWEGESRWKGSKASM